MFKKILMIFVLLSGAAAVNAVPSFKGDTQRANDKLADDLETYSQILRIQEAGEQRAIKKQRASLKNRKNTSRKKTTLEYLPAKVQILKGFRPIEKTFNVYDNNLIVEATAYTSHVDQTDDTPNIAAWGDRLSDGMKAIAVSRDLLNEYGMMRGTKVKIKGLPGEYLVLDKMNKRWKKKIDIYMGMDKSKAFAWGRRKVQINWD